MIHARITVRRAVMEQECIEVGEEEDITADATAVVLHIAHTDNRKIMRSAYEVNCAIDRYADTVRRICLLHLKNYDDTEDIFQTVFLKYMLYNGTFCDKEHEKAWIIRVTINACKDFLKSFYRKNVVSLEEVYDIADNSYTEKSDVLDAVLSLPEKYKNAVYLHYYEGYTAAEISKVIGKKENTVYTLLLRARSLLKDKLGGEGFE